VLERLQLGDFLGEWSLQLVEPSGVDTTVYFLLYVSHSRCLDIDRALLGSTPTAIFSVKFQIQVRIPSTVHCTVVLNIDIHRIG
jgi:hypothetical protein